MYNQKAKEIMDHVRRETSPISDIYIIFIGNTLGAFTDTGKTPTKENLEVVLKGFAISITLGYICNLDLEAETDTFLTDKLVEDVSNLIWEDWLKENVEKTSGENVVPLKAVN